MHWNKKKKMEIVEGDKIIEAIKIICKTFMENDISESAGYAAMMSMIESKRAEGRLPIMVFKDGEKS